MWQRSSPEFRPEFRKNRPHRSIRHIAAVLLAVLLAAASSLSGCKPPDPAQGGKTGNIAVDATHDYGQNIIHKPLEAGKKTECQSNLQQLRSAITMHKDSEGQFPASLGDLGSQMKAVETCPASGQPYQYDPASGRVWCTNPGHERL